MGDRYLTDLADVLRSTSRPVIELDGWRDRARGSGGYDSGRPSVVMTHHTASPPSSSGRPDAEYCALWDEDAPLSNLYLDRDGAWWILAAGATNTNGAGGPLAGVPEDSMNTHAIGIEANGGYGADWPAVQTDSYVIGVAALCRAYGIDDVFAHFEWAPSRKIDPAGRSPWADGDWSWDMDAFRYDVAVCPDGGKDDEVTDADINKIVDKVCDRIEAKVPPLVWAEVVDSTDDDNAGKPARYYLQRTYLICHEHLGPYK